MEKYEVVSKISKTIDYNSRRWNKEIIDRYLLRYDDKRIIECMTIIHLNSDEYLDLTVELSNMYNCIVGCRFCASGSLPESRIFLKGEDYLRQVETCLEASNVNPLDYKMFHIAFTGIGEPSLVKEEIARGIKLIKDKYPNVEVNIATTGFDPSCFKYWSGQNLPIRTLQLPYYSCIPDKMKYIIQNLPVGYDLGRNIEEAIKYKREHNLCRVKVNFVVIDEFNSSNDDLDIMLSYLERFKEDIILKISFLNYTKKCQEFGLKSPDYQRMVEIIARIKRAGFDCYLFGTANNTELGCGQLVQNYISQDGEEGKRFIKRYPNN
ncbi:MAG TPA: hypothetical protein DCE23_08155 [Firmicutes bacterium]|nr:hypothetical protein [Bacillota bacterium]